MKVYINFPDNAEDKITLENNLANFHSKLVIKAIENLNISDTSKSKVLKQVLERLKPTN